MFTNICISAQRMIAYSVEIKKSAWNVYWWNRNEITLLSNHDSDRWDAVRNRMASSASIVPLQLFFHRPPSTAQCVLCSVYFSAQPNKLRPILKFKKYYPVEHIFVPACSSARKIHFWQFYTTCLNILFVGIRLGWTLKTLNLLGWIPTVERRIVPPPPHHHH